MNLFSIFVDFAQYLGTPKAALMVAAYFLGDFLLKRLPIVLDRSAISSVKDVLSHSTNFKELNYG